VTVVESILYSVRSVVAQLRIALRAQLFLKRLLKGTELPDIGLYDLPCVCYSCSSRVFRLAWSQSSLGHRAWRLRLRSTGIFSKKCAVADRLSKTTISFFAT
jgi:hypothetical protein